MRSFGTTVTFSILFLLTILAFTSAQAQTYKVIWSFTGGLDGANPEAGLTMDRAGNLYGTTYNGGRSGDCPFAYPNPGCGTVFKLAPNAFGWKFTWLYLFTGGSDDAQPEAGVIFGPNGSLYGTTYYGGGDPHQPGTVYNLRPAAHFSPNVLGNWTESQLYRFQGYPSDGQYPSSNPVFDQTGNLYGTTTSGGPANAGIVWELTPSGSGWKESVIYSFTGGNDGGSGGTLILDQSSNLYGTASGGSYGFGRVFQLVPSNGVWVENTLYSFEGYTDGEYPSAGVVFDNLGNLYGTAEGGRYGGYISGSGTVFKLTPSNGTWTITVLYTFTGGSDGAGPQYSGLVFDQSGNLYGTTYEGGAYNEGVVFKLTPHSNGNWTETVLHSFSGGNDGAVPIGNVVLDANGNLYGTTLGGGKCGNPGCGVVWEITP